MSRWVFHIFLRAGLLFYMLFTVHVFAQEIPGSSNWYRTMPDTAAVRRMINSAKGLIELQPDKGIHILSTALRESVALKYNYGTAYALMGIAICHAKKGNFEYCIKMFQQAIPFCMKVDAERGQTRLTAALYNNMSMPYRMLGKYEEAANYTHRSILLSERDKNTEPDALIYPYCNLASLLVTVKREDAALYYLRKAEQIAVDQGDSLEIFSVWLNMANVLINMLKPDVAEPYVWKVYEYSRRKEGIPLGLKQMAFINMGSLLEQKGQSELLVGKIDEAKRLRLDQGIDQFTTASYYLLMGTAYIKVRDYQHAEAMLEKALLMAEESQLRVRIPDLLYKLAMVYSATNRGNKAYSYLQRYQSMTDSIKTAQNTNAINSMEVKYRTAEKDRKIALQENTLRKKNLQLFAATGGAVLLIVIIALLISIQRSGKIRQKFQDEKIQNLQHTQEIQQLRATMKGEENERRRIASQIHDHIMTRFSAIKMNMSVLPNKYADLSGAHDFKHIMTHLDDAMRELRTTAHNLMPGTLLEGGLTSAVHFFCKGLNVGSEVNISYQQYGTFPKLQPEFELQVYRMVQELVQNIIKHAKATQALVQLSCQDERLFITVEDNGVGMPDNIMAKETKGMGLKSIYAYATILNGHVEIAKQDEKGTIVYLEFDIRPVTIKNDKELWA